MKGIYTLYPVRFFDLVHGSYKKPQFHCVTGFQKTARSSRRLYPYVYLPFKKTNNPVAFLTKPVDSPVELARAILGIQMNNMIFEPLSFNFDFESHFNHLYIQQPILPHAKVNKMAHYRVNLTPKENAYFVNVMHFELIG